jgi:UDP-N-acetylmuramoyl-tripeptide--D-alanyl-D-alanine ligase
VEERSLKYVAGACGAEMRGGTEGMVVKDVCTDSRSAKAGDLFFAIKGEKFDGHEFVAEVAAKGASAVVVEKSKAGGLKAKVPERCGLLAVDDVRAAYGKLAAVYRGDFSPTVTAVGGSNGKTTTKELIASVLRQKLPTLWSEASFNNDIGVPTTLLKLTKAHQAAVLEAGTNHPGELAPLVSIIQPKIGVITNIGREHLEFFGDVDGVAREEGWLAELLPANGTLYLNGDGAWADIIAARTKAGVVRVGIGDKNDWQATRVRLDKSGVTFQVTAPKVEYSGEYRVNLLGRHQVVNALLAIGSGEEHGLGRAEIQRGLAECQPVKMRMQFWEAGGVRVLEDCYNANADSMSAALETLCDLPFQGRRVAVLGDMAELGAQSEAAHAEIGRRAAELKIGQLFTVGKNSSATAKAARDAGLTRVIEFPDVEAAVRAVKNFLKSGDVVLLKASRSSRLERIAETLRSPKLPAAAGG